MAWPTIISVLVLKCTPVLTKIIDCSCNSNKLHRTECNDENGENPIFQPAAWACNFNLLIQSILKHHGTFIGLTINSSFYVQCKKWPNQNLEFICSNHLKIIIRYEFRCRLKIDCFRFSYGLNPSFYSFRLFWKVMKSFWKWSKSKLSQSENLSCSNSSLVTIHICFPLCNYRIEEWNVNQHEVKCLLIWRW